MVALFAGGGGLHLGFRKSGFETVFASDSNPESELTFKSNFPNVKFFNGDIRQLTPSRIRELTEGVPIDVVIGGPPCQGFSTLGDQLQADPRNGLFEAFARVISWLQPRCVLIENTSYLRSQYSGRYELEISRTLSTLGYRVEVRTLNAVDYGAPQIRKRVFFVCTRLSHGFEWPAKTHGEGPKLKPWLTVGDVIMDIAAISQCPLQGHEALNHSDKVISRYRLIPEGGRLPPPQLLPKEIRRRNFGNTYKRLHRAKPSLTLVPGNNPFPVHPTEDRSLTPREAARIQGFPDTFTFTGNRSEQCKLVGNAVPVALAEALGTAIKNHLEQGDAECSVLDVKKMPDSQMALSLDLPLEPPKKRSGLTAVSLFSGAGGMLLGFVRAGFEILSSYDRKSIVDRNIRMNFPELTHHSVDLSTYTQLQIQAAIGRRTVDVVFAGTPCQGFSVFGRRRFVRTKGHDPETDERNLLTLHFISLATALNPKVIVIENVKGLLSTPFKKGTYMEAVERRLKRRGYSVKFKVLNCADYGVPQSRERLIVVATRPGIDFDWPQPKFFAEPKPWQHGYSTVGDVIADLQDPATHSAEFSHVPMKHGELLVKRFSVIPEGGKLPDEDLAPEHRKGYRSNAIKNYSHVYKRLSRSKPAATLVPGHNAFPLHPTLPRSLTVREAARIQTFPDWMRFVGTRQQQCMLVGNAVPPTLAGILAQAVAKAIKGKSKRADYKADDYELKLTT